MVLVGLVQLASHNMLRVLRMRERNFFWSDMSMEGGGCVRGSRIF